jgi:DNA-binding response OmpR family regulator
MPAKPAILVVDDDPILREIASQMLAAHGYDCRLAEDGEIALAALRAAPADLVVLDMIMPNKEGIETLREIKREWPHISVLMISAGTRAMAAPSLLSMAMALGADEVIEKPLYSETFIAAVRRALRDRT